MGDNSSCTHGLHLFCYLFFILVFEINGSCLLNSEGLALLQFRSLVEFDPSGALENWNPNDCDPCLWSGIKCSDGKVVVLNLSGCELEGELSPDLGSLTYLRCLDLSKNLLSGTIPPQLGQLTTLEVLDLRDNNLSGLIPTELGELHSLKRLLLCNNRFEGPIPVEIGILSLLSDVQFDDVFSTAAAAAGICCINRKFGHSIIWQSVLKQSRKSDIFQLPLKESITNYLNLLPRLMTGTEPSENHPNNCCGNLTNSSESDVIEDGTQDHIDHVHRILADESTNLASLPNSNSVVPTDQDVDIPGRSSGSFPAAPNQENNAPSPQPASEDGNSGTSLKIIIGILILILLLIIFIVLFCIMRNRANKKINQWKSGTSAQLQKPLVTAVPMLNREELETACEDFSNIIFTHEFATSYKGILSTGVEVAVVSTAMKSLEEWSKQSEMLYRNKIEGLSQVNHKNFVNLIGYCEENEPFTRMMVFEYAPNGTLLDYLHVKDFENLEWDARMRILMGTAYCIQHLHNLDPPVTLHSLTCNDVLLTDDYAAKIADINFWEDHSNTPTKNESENSEVLGVEKNIHSFGMLMLEIISGKVRQSKEADDVLQWVNEYLNNRTTASKLIDPTLNSSNEKHLRVICEAIQSCVNQNSKKKNTMQEVIEKLREAINVSPDAAKATLSPLWWAELEILSSEAA